MGHKFPGCKFTINHRCIIFRDIVFRGRYTTPVQEATSRKRKLRWLHETFKEAQELVGNPKWSVKDNRPPEWFGSYFIMVSNIIEFEPSSLCCT